MASLTPCLVVPRARGLLRFLESVLEGWVVTRETRGDGSLGHAEVRIGDTIVVLGDAPQGHASFPAMMRVRVLDADATYARALEAGATPVRAPEGTPRGERAGAVRDAWGNEWWLVSAQP